MISLPNYPLIPHKDENGDIQVLGYYLGNNKILENLSFIIYYYRLKHCLEGQFSLKV